MNQYNKYFWYPVLYSVSVLQLFLSFIESHTSSWTDTLNTWNKSLTKKVNK